MKLLLTVLALAVVSVAGARLLFRSRRTSLGIRLFFSSGTHFLLLGFLIGPHVAGVLSEGTFESLVPFVALGLAWIGILFGLQFEREALERFGPAERRTAIGQGLVTWVVMAGGIMAGLAATNFLDARTAALALAAAAAGAASSPTGAAVVFGSARVGGPSTRLATLAASLDGAVSIGALALVYAVFHPAVPEPALGVDLGALRWLLAPVLLALLMGWIFLSLSRDRPPAEELALFLLGLALVLAGTSLSLFTSTLFASALTGAFIARFSPLRRRVYTALAAWEQPVHVLFLTLAGSLLSFRTPWVVVLAGAYVLVRAAGKIAGGALARPLLRRQEDGSPLPFGLALLSQGGVSVAVAVSSYLGFHGEASSDAAVGVFLDAVLLGIVVNEMVGPPLMRRVLLRAGEIQTAGS